MSRIRITQDNHEVTVDTEAGGRAVSWRWHGQELLVGSASDPLGFGMYVMAPWAGRIAGNSAQWQGIKRTFDPNAGDWAVHGSAYHAPVVGVDRQSEPGSDTVTVHQELDDWFVPVHLSSRWEVSADRLVTSITARCDSQVSVPFSCGWHPWFRRELTDGSQLSYNITGTRFHRVNQIDTQESSEFTATDGPFDDTLFIPSREVMLSWGEQLAVTVTSSSPWFVLYDAPEHAVCLEPQSGPPNCFAEPLGSIGNEIPAGGELSLTTTWSFA